jgi:hypothetical protein
MLAGGMSLEAGREGVRATAIAELVGEDAGKLPLGG